MKSKMKSAFAIIAVALMIMVAVVPMVGMFAEESSAATTIVPGDKTSKITVEGTVTDSSTQKLSNALIEVSYDTYYEYALTGTDGKFSVAVNYEGASVNLKVSVVISDDIKYAKYSGLTTPNPADGKFTTSNNSQEIKGVSGNVSGINFMSGYVTISGKITYANATQAYDKTVTVTATAAAAGSTPINGTFDEKTGMYAIIVPIDSGKMTISAGTEFDTKEVTVAKSNITSGGDLKIKDVYKAYVVYADEANTLSAAEGSGIGFIDSLAPVMIDGVYAGKYSFSYKFKPEGGDKKITISDTNGCGYPQDMTLSTSPSDYTFKENAYIKGTIKMGNVLVAEAEKSKLEIEYYKDSAKQSAGPSSVTYDIKNGTYTILFGKVTEFEGINKVVVTYKIDDATKKSTGSITIPTKTSSSGVTSGTDISLPTTGYYLISGTIKNGTTAVPMVKVAVTSTDAVGVVSNEVMTGTDGKYSFYAKSGNNVQIVPDSTATFVPGSQEFVAIADKIVDFMMDSKKFTTTEKVTDADNVTLTGVTVKYRVGMTGTFSDATFNKDGTFTVETRSNVTTDDIYVYFEKTGYTFAATAAAPVKMSTANFKANEQTLTFEVKDFAGNAIKDISGITFQVAKYKIHAIGTNVNAFDMIGTPSDATYDATTGMFSFIAIPSTEAGDYRMQYGISVKTNSTDYSILPNFLQ